jgi:hypothetical protein
MVMRYLKRFNENVSFYDYLEPGKLWTSIGASSYEKMEYWGNQENITSSEDKILDELVNNHIVSLGWKLKSVDKQKYEMEHRPGRLTDYRREYVFNSITSLPIDIKFLKYEDDLWLIESFIPRGTISISKMWVCDTIEGVKDCIENNFVK